MVIEENDISDEDDVPSIPTSSWVNFNESESEEEDNVNVDIEWSTEKPEGVIYDHFQFTGSPRGPVKPVTTYLECLELFLTDEEIF